MNVEYKRTKKLRHEPLSPEELVQRNKSIYRKRKEGHTYASIAKEFNLDRNTISNICRRIDRILAMKKRSFAAYEELLEG